MSLVKRTAKKSPRLIAIGLLITLFSIVVSASRWDSVTSFVRQNLSAGSPILKAENTNILTEAPEPQTKAANDNLLVALTGTKTIPGDYPDLAAAIADLNAQGVGAGGVTFNLLTGNPQTAPAGGYVIGGTGSLVLTSSSAANPIVFNGGGNNIFAPTPQVAGNLNDAIFKLIGADFVTLNDFKMKENVGNTTTAAGTNNMTEFGVALFYVTTTDGAQNNNIFSSTFDLNRTYQNTFAIYSNSTHSATTVTTTASATGAAGSNSGLKIQANAISNANMGIVVVGPTAAADQADTLDIGGNALAFGNTMTDIGTTGTFSGYANVSGTVNGILVRNTKNFNVSNNNIQMSNGGVTVSGTINGIQIPASSNAPTGTLTQTINNNQISVRGGNIANVLNGINMPSGSVNATTTVNMNGNDFNTFGHTVAGGTGAITFISHGGNPLVQTMNANTFTNISVNTTGTITFFSFAPSLISGASFSLSGNSIVTGFTRTGVGSATLWASNASSVLGSTHAISNNNFSNITLTGASAFTGISDTDGPTTGGPVKNVNGNTFNNITTGAGTVAPMSVNFSGANSNVNNNTISNITTTNTITALTLGSSNLATLTSTGNVISGINSGGTVVGLTSAAIGAVISKNKIYDLNGSAATSTISALTVANATASSTVTVSNNLIGNLTTPLATSSNGIIGINIAGTATTSNFNVYYNTVYLNNTTSGAGFGSSGINAITNTTATTSTLNLRNNIIVNTSVQNGAGLTVAYRRSAGTAGNLANYASTSNNNLFYAGTPSATNLIYADGTSSAQTIFNYKNGVFTAGTISPRDSASISENPPFLSTTGSSPNFLHINPATPTQIESGGIPVAGITDDFDGNTRNVSTPDIGADEFTGVALDLSAPSITYTALLNTSSTANRVLTATITDASGVAGGALAPRIYFRKNAEAYFSTQCSGSSPTYTCTIDYSLVGGGTVAGGDIIQYFVVAQDTAGNVGANPSGGFTATNVNSVTSPPTTPNQYNIAASISGSFNVGTAETYTSLTNAGGIFEYINNNEVVGNITINITSDLTGELGTNALNQFASPHTILIRPSGAARSITGPAAATALIRLNGASRVTIDGSLSGGTDRSLTIENTSVTTPQVVRFGSIGAAAIVNDTIKNCIIRNGVNTSSAVVVTDNAGTAGTFNNITIQNNDVQKAFVGIFTNATVGAGNGSGLTITQNNVDATVANAIRNVGIYVQGADGATVSNNTVGNFNATNDENDTGIWLAAGAVNTTVSGNTVTTLGYTGTSTFGPFGIRDSGGSAASGNTITQNNISNITSNGTINTGPTVFGIEDSSGGTIIQRNNVQGIIAASTGTFGAAGINITGGNNVVVRNNFVSNVTGDMTGGAAFSTTFGIFGIRVAAGTGHQIYNNSVNMYGLRTGVANTTLLTAAFAIVSTASTGMDVRNNIFANNITGGTTSIANVSVFLPSGGTAAMNLTWNNNSYYFGTDAARQGAGQAGTTAGTNFFTTLAALTAYTGTLGSATNDNASLGSTGAVPFTSNNDLHLTAGVPELNVGATIASVTNDYDGNLRPQGAGYEIGADEIVVAAPGTIQFSSATYSVTEGTPTVTLTVTRTGGSGGAVTANYTLGGGTATGTASCGAPGEDYVNTGNSVIFADGDAADKTFTVTICNDAVYELAQTFNATLAIGSGTATLGTPNPATVTINNDDAAPTVAVNDISVAEGNAGTTTLSATATITGPSEVAGSFQLQSADNTATAGSDYTAVSLTPPVTANVNRTTAVITIVPAISINGDTMFESNETFFLNASNCVDCTIVDNQGVATIQNDDVQPTVQFSSATYTNSDDIAANIAKGDEFAPQVATITVTRAGAAGDAFSVNYATSNGTATGGASCTTGIDYVSTNGTLSFAVGDTSKTFNVTVCTDALFEGDETVNLTLTAPTAPVILGTPATAVLTITDNDAQPALQFSSATYSNSDDISKFGVTTDELAPSVATITVTRTGATDNVVAVNYATSNGTATGGASCTTGIDYISTSGTLNFALGDTSKTFNVTVCTDGLFEGNETVNLTLSSPTAPAMLGTPNSAVLTIVDNDAQPSLQFNSATYSIGEAGPAATITVTRTGAPDNAVSVNYASSNGTATGGATCSAGVDYQNTSGTLNFASGDTSKTFTVPVCEDALLEGNETVNLALSSPSANATLGSQSTATLTIQDNEVVQPGTVQFAQAFYTVGEGAGSVTLSVTRTGGSDGAIGVNYVFAGGSASGAGSCAAGIDYAAVSGTLNWANGDSASKTINVSICEDALVEGNENFLTFLNTPTGGATVGAQSSTDTTITDNDTAPSVQFSSATYSTVETLGNSGVVPSVTITVTRTGATENAFNVNYATSNGTATGGASCAAGIDYVSASGTLSFASGDTSKTFPVQTCPDTVYEGDETVNLALTGPTAPAVLGSPNTAVLTIVENDTQPSVQFSAATYTEDESQTAGIGITRTGDTSGTTTVNFATSNGTAAGGASCTAGIDYVTNSGTVTFNPGVVSQIVSIQLCSDTMNESGETINLTLSGPSAPATLGVPNTAVLTINDTASQYRNVTNIDVTGTLGSPYPANIVVSGGPATIGSVKVTLYDVNHALADDLDVLLVGPGGQKFILMADAGGANGLTSPVTITFDDQAAQVLPDNGTILTGKYEPTNCEPGQTSFAAPAPAAPYSEPGSTVGGAVTLNSIFSGTNSNGTWSLYTRNDNGAFVPVGGNIAGGWGLQILAPTAANAEIGGRLVTAYGEGIRNATVMLSGGNLTQPLYVQTGTFGNYRFSNLPVGQIYVITVISKRYTFPNPSRVINLTDSATEENFEAEAQ